MMKRSFIVLLALVLVLCSAAPAFADVIWEPTDPFYMQHRDHCYFINRSYTFAGDGGEVEIWNEPEGRARNTRPNGEKTYISYGWTDGDIEWGYIEDDGWVRMEDMTLVYDSQEFIKDHAGQFKTADSIEITFSDALLYDYPGGPTEGSVTDYSDTPFSGGIDFYYTDEAGVRWGHVIYIYGHRDKWIKLDAPMGGQTVEGNAVIIGEQDVDIDPILPQPVVDESIEDTDVSYAVLLLIAALSVAVVAAVTVALIFVLTKKK